MLVRVEVEPCELELSNDRLLPLATLQAAFPGCTGLSYKAEDGSKRALSFDGQAFHPPQQGWEQVKQFTVGLGGKQSFPFDSYENASKQFERAVNNVERLMNQELEFCSPPSPPSPGSNPRERLRTFRRRVSNYRDSQEDITVRGSLEAQLAELSAILLGKDAIIESLSGRLNAEKEAHEQLLRSMELSAESSQGDVQEWRARTEALEMELKLFRDMGAKQENMSDRCKALSNEIEELKNTSNTRIHSIQTEYDRVCRELGQLNQQHERLLEMHSQTCHTLDETKKQFEEVRQLLEELRGRFAESERDYSEQLRAGNEVRERICNENVQLQHRLTEAESALSSQRQALQDSERHSQAQSDAMFLQLKEKYASLLAEHEEKIEETATLNRLIEQLNRHLTDITVKYKDLRSARDGSPTNRYFM